MDSYTHYAMVAADEAINDSKLQIEKMDSYRCGVIWASGVGGLGSFQNEVVSFGQNNQIPRFTPYFIPKFIADIAAGLISIKYGFHGPNFATVSACASSTNALIDAFNYIRLGKADCILSGGSEAAITETGIGGFMNMKALSQRNESPQTACRPFDKTRDGFVLGEGAGAILLEELEHARKRGAKIYAEVVGSGATADAYHMTAPHPDGQGAYMAMKMAMAEAGISPAEVDYVNTHATSTPVGDLGFTNMTEALSLERVKVRVVGSDCLVEGYLPIKD